MAGMITLPGALLDQFGHPWQGPHRRGVTVSLRARDDRRRHVRLLRRAQPGLGPGRTLTVQRRRAALLPLPLPGVRRLTTHLEEPRHLTRSFALGEQFRRFQPPFLHRSMIALLSHAQPKHMSGYYASLNRHKCREAYSAFPTI